MIKITKNDEKMSNINESEKKNIQN